MNSVAFIIYVSVAVVLCAVETSASAEAQGSAVSVDSLSNAQEACEQNPGGRVYIARRTYSGPPSNRNLEPSALTVESPGISFDGHGCELHGNQSRILEVKGSATLTMTNTTLLKGLQQSKDGGGVKMDTSSTGLFSSCAFQENGHVGEHIYACKGCHQHNDVPGQGGAVYSYNARAVFSTCTFNSNKAKTGGGVYLVGTHSGSVEQQGLFSSCLFRANAATAYGGGAVWVKDSFTQFSTCAFHNNSAWWVYINIASNGGDVFLACGRQDCFTHQNRDDSSFVNCTFQSVSFLHPQFDVKQHGTAGHGGAVHMVTINGSFVGCTFNSNTAKGIGNFGDGGAVYMEGRQNNAQGEVGTGTFSRCTFHSNIAAMKTGGAVFAKQGNLTFKHCIFQSNKAMGDFPNGNGGAVYMTDMHSGILFSICTFEFNFAEKLGGCVAVEHRVSVSFSSSHFRSSLSRLDGGGGVNIGNSPAAGVTAIEKKSLASHGNFSMCEFRNTSTLHGIGGGVHVVWGGTTLFRCTFHAKTDPSNSDGREGLVLESGVLSLSSCVFDATMANASILAGVSAVTLIADFWEDILISHCSFLSNRIDGEGGAVCVDSSSAGGHLVSISTSTFCGNTASNRGGGLYFNSIGGDPAKIAHCIFESNRAQTGAALSVAFLITTTEIAFELRNSTFLTNEASSRGGGLAFYDSGHVRGARLVGCRFFGNRAPVGPSIFWTGKDPVTSNDNLNLWCSHRAKMNWDPSNHATLASSVANGEPLSQQSIVSAFGACKQHLCAPSSGSVRTWSAEYRKVNEVRTLEFSNRCVPCPEGKTQAYDSGTGGYICKSCGANEYVEANTTACLPCPKGSFCLDGVRTNCPSGQYSDVLRAASCINCEAGQFANSSGTSRCVACDKGTRQADAGQSNCLSCAAGTIQAAASSTECEKCEAGQFAASNGTSRCTACEPGTRQQESGKSTCEHCPAGTIQSAKASATCTSCEDGAAYQDHPGQTVCKNCDTCERGYSVNVSQICSPASGGVRKQDNTTNATIPKYCRRCTPGRFGENTNAPNCTVCPRGFFQSLLGRIEICDSCPEGTFAASTGAVSCILCPIGHFSRLPSQAECSICDAGQYARTGNTSCALCPTGFHSSSGMGACIGCDAGMHAKFRGLATCDACSKGTVQPNPRMSSCETCLPGFFQDEEGQGQQSGCKRCRAGRYAQDNKAFLCMQCDDVEREYTASSGAAECRTCAPHARVVSSNNTCACSNAETSSKEGAVSKSYFEVGFDFGAFPNATASIAACDGSRGTPGCCRLCPDGAECRDGRVYVLQGYWRRGNAPLGQVELMKCPALNACPGTRPAHKVVVSGHVNASAPPSRRVGNRVADGPCREGHEGPVCATCRPGWKPALHDLCQDCGDGGKEPSRTPKLLVLVIGSMLVLCIVTWAVTRSDTVSNKMNNEKTKGLADHSKKMNDSRHTIDNVTTMLPFLQRFSAMQTAFGFDWPELAVVIFRWFALAYGSFADAFKMFSPCALHMVFAEVLLAQILATPWMLVLAALVLGLAKSMAWRMQRQRAAARAAMERATSTKKRRRLSRIFKMPPRFQITTVRVRLISLLMSAIRFLYPGIGSVILKSFRCITIGNTPVLMASVEITCWSEEYWSRVGILSIFAVAVIVVGIPVALATVVQRESTWLRRQNQREDAERILAVQRLFQNRAVSVIDHARDLARDWKLRRRRHETQMHSAVVRRFVRPFKPRYWWWFILEMLLSLFLIGVLATFPDVGTQVAVGGAAALVQVVLPASLWPFRRARENHIAVTGGILYFLNFLSGLAKWMAASAPATRRQAQLASADTAIVVTVVIIVCAVSLVLLDSLASAGIHILRYLFKMTSLVKVRVSIAGSVWQKSAQVRPGTGTGGAGKKRKRKRRNTRQDGRQEEEEEGPVIGLGGAIGTEKRDTGKDKESPEEVEAREYEALRPSLQRVEAPAWHVIHGAPPTLRKRYVEKWMELVALHAEISTVAMQAVTRGFLRRRLGSLHRRRSSAVPVPVPSASASAAGPEKENIAVAVAQAPMKHDASPGMDPDSGREGGGRRYGDGGGQHEHCSDGALDSYRKWHAEEHEHRTRRSGETLVGKVFITG